VCCVQKRKNIFLSLRRFHVQWLLLTFFPRIFMKVFLWIRKYNNQETATSLKQKFIDILFSSIWKVNSTANFKLMKRLLLFGLPRKKVIVDGECFNVPDQNEPRECYCFNSFWILFFEKTIKSCPWSFIETQRFWNIKNLSNWKRILKLSTTF
jgi:hypothetical protein